MSTLLDAVVATFYSDVDDLVSITGGSTDVTLPSVVLPNLAAAVLYIYAGLKFRMIENTDDEENAINGAATVQIKKSTGAWGVDDVTGIDIADNMWTVGAYIREGGDVVMGDNDVASEVDAFNATYNMRFEDIQADENDLDLYDVQTFLTVAYR